jgi:hypothetical protein
MSEYDVKMVAAFSAASAMSCEASAVSALSGGLWLCRFACVMNVPLASNIAQPDTGYDDVLSA